MSNDSPSSSELRMDPAASAQFSYHVHRAAVCGLAGESEESASEAVLAWSMLTSLCPGAAAAAAEAGSELIDSEPVTTSQEQRRRAQARARDLALSLEAHFVSVGQRDLVDLYAQIVADLDAALESLAS
jgi:hypothetical protein